MGYFWCRVLCCCGLILAMPCYSWDVAEAHTDYLSGHYSALHDMADQAPGHLLGSYVQYWWLLTQLQTVEPAVVEQFLQKNQGTWVAESLRRAWIGQLSKRQAWSEVLNQVGLLVQPYSDGSCYAWLAQIHLGEKLNTDTINAFWHSPHSFSSACILMVDAVRQQGRYLSDDQLWLRIRLDFDHGYVVEAQHWAEQLGHPLKTAQISQAQNSPERFLNQADFSRRQMRALGLYALSILVRHDLDRASTALNAVADHWPAGAVAHAWEILAIRAGMQHDLRALDWFSRAAPLSDTGRKWELRAALRQSDWQTVQKIIEAMPDTLQQERWVRYWQARADSQVHQLQAGRSILAELAQQDDYYGLLARTAIGPMLIPVSHVQTDADLIQEMRNFPGIQRALALRSADLRTEAFREWNWTVSSMDDAHLLAAAEVASREGWYDRAIYTAERTKSSSSLQLRYLMPYKDVLESYATELHLDPAWVYGLIRQESRFVVVAHSGVGAKGLMQLMPQTAQWVANKLGVHYHATMVNEVGTNVQLGTYYLRHILDLLGGNPVLATAAYNAGPRRAREWQGSAPLDASIYIETIPFSETRDYVKKVLTNAEHYARRLEPEHDMMLKLAEIPPRSLITVKGP